MATRRVIKSVLWNFLDTYISRYSHYQGYWLLSFLAGTFRERRINLLGESVPTPETPMGVAVLSAVEKFADQLGKAGLAISQVRAARLTICCPPNRVRTTVNGRRSNGFYLRLAVVAKLDNGKVYERDRVVLVAPHNPRAERRSGGHS